MNSYTITINEAELALIRSTFAAREIRVREWISEAKRNKDEKEVAHWSAIVDMKKALMKNVNDQCKSQGASDE